MDQQPARTGRTRRERRTSPWVWFGEYVSRYLITVGGIGTVLALATVFVFLLAVVVPLFQSGTVLSEATTKVDWSKMPPIQLGTDEEQQMGWALFADGRVQVVKLDDGAVLEERRLFDDPKLTAWSFASGLTTAPCGSPRSASPAGCWTLPRSPRSFMISRPAPSAVSRTESSRARTAVGFGSPN
jgi:hypothetical protein